MLRPPPPRQVDYPLGCHRQRISERVVFAKLVQILVFGYTWAHIAGDTRSATTLRRRRVAWISLMVFAALPIRYAVTSEGLNELSGTVRGRDSSP
jgi:hypothetical protein